MRTGDLGRVDEQGRLRLVGPGKEMYVRGGYNVYPMEVEAVLAAHPAVAEVAVVPRADDVMGEIGVAVRRRPRPAPRRRRSTTCGRSPPSRWRRTSCPTTLVVSTRCRSRRWRSSTAGRPTRKTG